VAEDGLVVFQLIGNDSKCDGCGCALYKGRMLRKEGEKGLCLDCADLGHLAFLAAGNVCVTRRAKKYSPISVVVVRWSRSRKRYERQGLLVTNDSIERAEADCFGDEVARSMRQSYDADRRRQADAGYVRAFASEVRRRYPSAPEAVEQKIAFHACEMHSGRIGRTAAAKDFDPGAVDLAVRAHIRHLFTNYDELLNGGRDRGEARAEVAGSVDQIVDQWRNAS
jgi:hypothetical protein